MYNSIALSPQRSKDFLLRNVLLVSSLTTALAVVLIFILLIAESFPAIKSLGILRFFTDEAWYPTEGKYDLVRMFTGSVLAVFGALLLATPLGIFSAIFINYYAKGALATIYQRMIEIMAGLPSVIYGLWGLVVLVPIINNIQPPGASLLAAILVLTLMVFPTITIIICGAMNKLPAQYSLSSNALGLSRWTMIHGVVMPAIKMDTIVAMSLATGRAIGETMAVLMVCGNIVGFPGSIFDPIRTLTTNIALEMPYAVDTHRSSLFVSGLLLMVFTVVLVVITKKIVGMKYDEPSR